MLGLKKELRSEKCYNMLRYCLLAVFMTVAWAKDSYVVIAPSKLRPGMELSVSVNILTSTADVTVTASVVRINDNSSVATKSHLFKRDQPGTLKLKIPAELKSGSYELQVKGSGGLTFSNKTQLTFSAKAMSIFIQTDKAMYKPGQTVNFRAFGLYPDLLLYTGNLDIEIYDANSNKIKQWLNVGTTEGVLVQSLDLSTQPVMGDWKIKAIAGSVSQEKVFTVAEYVLPKFEVKVDLPSYLLTSAAEVPVTVSAKYTYGEPVAGSVVVEVKMEGYYYSNVNAKQPTLQHTAKLDKDGQAKISFPMSQIHQLANANQKLKFSANVTEALTGKTLNGSASVQLYQNAVKLEFLDSNPNTFKPGLDYIAYLKVSQPDGLPVAAAAGQIVKVTTTATAEFHETTTPYQYYFPRTMSYSLSPLSLTLPDNGLVVIQLTVPPNATHINIQASFDSASAYSSISKSYSPSDNFIQLFLRSSGRIQAGSPISFEVKGTEKLHNLVYQVLSRGSIVAAGNVRAGGATSYIFSLPTTAEMAPNARIVLYYVRQDGEIVTDSISFDVDGVFQNQVSISIDRAEAQPADTVHVTVRAAPKSTAHLLAVDQSVLLLKSGNDITADQVIDELKSYDTITSHKRFPFLWDGPIGIAERRKRMIWFPFPIYYGGSDANQIFSNAGVVVLTDALVYQYVKPYYGCPVCLGVIPPMAFNGVSVLTTPPTANMINDGLQEVEHVRTLFPETWLWRNMTASADGTATVTTTVPDTITSWVASAFAVSTSAGLGVAPTTSKLRVFRPFFVSLNLPYSVKRGEQVALQAIVFNYLPQDQQVRVSLAQSQDFYNLVFDANNQEDLRHEDQIINIRVPAGQGKSVFFPIVPANLGPVELIVSAQSTQAADAVRRQLLVKPEGVPKEYSVAVLVDLKNTTSFSKTVPLSLPGSVVAGSQRARITAIGDLMGPSVSGLDNLLTMPTGCGEQNMIGMAPDVFVSSYLTATNQLRGDIQEKAVKYMEHGYQRELTYQHKDGSFSAFGDQDDSGSMWLTAFVVKTFHQARPYVFIDEQLLTRAIDWMLARQNADGSFPEPGRVIHTDMKGGSGSGIGLTAFVLIALEENNDLQGSVSQRIASSKQKALAYLKQQTPSITDDYILAITAYALALAKDPTAASVFEQLKQRAVVKEGLKYWHKPTTSTSTTSYWRAPDQASASDVEMTAYALLTYAAHNDFIGGLTVMKWIASQRNPRGGYSSTQDTILALQALSEFAHLAYSKNFNIQVTATAGAFSKQFTIDQVNALVLQSADLPTIPSSLTVTAKGSGIALVEVAVFFNVETEVEEPTFEVTVNLLKDTLNNLNIKACSKWLARGSSGMAVQEIGIPSGFEADLESLQSETKIKRKETQDGKLVLYFDEIGATAVCTSLSLFRTGLVAKSQPVAVRVYDYYEPSHQATAFYQSMVLKGSSMCDVCQECSCPARRK